MKKSLSRGLLVTAIIVFVAFFGISSVFASSSVPNVLLLIADDGGGEPLRSRLVAFGDLGTIDVYDARGGTPSLATLLNYDAVITWSNYTYQNPTAIGDVLADYVDAGGAVINMMFAEDPNWGMFGRFMNEGYTAVKGTGTTYSTSCLGTYDAAHPVMNGITTVCDYYRLDGTYLTAGSTAVAYWTDGLIFVGVKDTIPVVSISGYPGFYYQWTGQMDSVVHNAIFSLMGPQLTVNINPAGGGTVKGGGINCPAGACSNAYVKGTTVALTATAKNSYRFKNWTGCNIPSGNLCTMLMNKSKTVTANFVGMYSISGRVVDQNGLPMPNVTVTLESVAGGGGQPNDVALIEALAADISRLTVTDAYGKYKFTQLPNGNYKVTPGDIGFTFTPLNQKVTILDGNQGGVNFRLVY
jgi:hypothetical protein